MVGAEEEGRGEEATGMEEEEEEEEGVMREVGVEEEEDGEEDEEEEEERVVKTSRRWWWWESRAVTGKAQVKLLGVRKLSSRGRRVTRRRGGAV